MTAFSAAAHDEGGDTTKALRARITELEDMLANLPLSSLQRLRARIQRLEEMLAAVGAGGVGPLIPTTVQHQGESSGDNELQSENGQLSTSSSTATAVWKLVPVEPTKEMLDAYVRLQARFNSARSDWAAMLAAAPLPPAPDQPQAEQPAMTQIAQRKLDSLLTEGYTISGYSVYHERKHQHGFVTGAGLVGWWKPEGMEYPQPLGEQEPVSWIENFEGSISYGPIHEAARKLPEGARFDLYTHPQPKLQPLTEMDIVNLRQLVPGTLDVQFVKFTRAIERAHGIGGEA